MVTCDLADVFTARGSRQSKSFKSMLVFVRAEGMWLWLAGQTMEPAWRHP